MSKEEIDQLLKEAGLFGQAAAGARGLYAGYQRAREAQRMAQAAQVIRAAGKKIKKIPGAPAVPPSTANNFFERARERIRGAREGAARAEYEYIKNRQDAARAVREQAATEALQAGGHKVIDPQSPKPPRVKPKKVAPKEEAVAPKEKAVASNAEANRKKKKDAPDTSAQGSGALPLILGGAALAAGGYGLHRSFEDAGEQRARAQDYYNNTKNNLTAPVPSMTVTASYDEFAREKGASNWFAPVMLSSTQAAVAKSLADTIGQRLVGDPLSAVGTSIKTKYFEEPKWKKNFEEVVASDPQLSRLHQQEPEVLPLAFETIKRFSPTLAKDRLATRSLLRHVAMSGGEMDFGTMKMLAETEKFHNEGRRK